MTNATSTEPAAHETIEPFALAELLGIDRAEIALLVTGAVRMPAGFAYDWRARSASELTVAEAARLVNRPRRTVTDWIAVGLLTARKAGRRQWRISPAALIAFLKAQTAPTMNPRIVETPTQRDRRAKKTREEALELCAKPKRARKSA